MLRDAQGLAVTTNCPQAIAAIDQFVGQSLSYGNHPEVILEAIAADPGCAIAYAASYYLSLESAIGRRQALPYLQAAKNQAQVNEREQLSLIAQGFNTPGSIS